MKTINSLFAVAVLGLSTILFAGNAYAFLEVIPMNTMDKAAVHVVVPKNQNSSIYISDPEGRIIHRETIKSSSSNGKVYNFSNLDEGVYTFYSETDHANFTKKVKVENSSVEVISNEVEYKPAFIVEDEKLMVNYLNLDQEKIKMAVYSSYADYYNSTEGNSKVFQKKFDISGLDSGEYFAMIKVGDKNFIHNFNID